MDGFSPRGGNNKQLNVLGGLLEPCKSNLGKNKFKETVFIMSVSLTPQIQ